MQHFFDYYFESTVAFIDDFYVVSDDYVSGMLFFMSLNSRFLILFIVFFDAIL